MVRRRTWWAWGVLAAVVFGCEPEPTTTDAAGTETGATNALPDESSNRDSRADVPDGTSVRPPGAVSPLPPSTVLGRRRSYRVARGIVHSHTVLSHDACDGEPRDSEGSYNESCLQDWRDGICETRMDFVFNTDHDEFAALEPYRTLLLKRDGDELVRESGRVVANRLRCENGSRVMVLPGIEAGLMPVGLTRHLEGSPAERNDKYGDATSERVASLRDAGAVVLQAHTESKSTEKLRELGLDGFEIYNLHANVAPDIREEHLGLKGTGFVEKLRPFLDSDGPHPDLAMMAIFAPNQPALDRFDTLLAEGFHLVGTAGNDTHRNTVDIELRDGERGDSFRRMMKLFSTHLLVHGDRPSSYRDALRHGRSYAAFEYLGTPVNFDFRADVGDRTVEMGETASMASRPRLEVEAPRAQSEAVDVVPTVELIRAEKGGGSTVVRKRGDLAHTPTEPGAYRVVVRILPEYLRPYLGSDPDQYLEEPLVWIYSNPIYIEK